MMHQSLTAVDFINVAVRRKWLIMAVLVFSGAVAFAVCLVWPKSFRSSTIILVESQKVPETYVKGVVSGTIQERLSSVRQVVLSRPLLSQVAAEVGLVPDLDKGADPLVLDAVVVQMRKNVVIDISKEQSTLKLSFTHSNPAIARDVTSKIASFVVEDNLKRREQLFEGATEFLQEELKMAKAELETREQAISEFKSRNMGELPQQMEANLRSLDRLQSERTSSAETINALSSRLDSLEKAIREFQPSEAVTALLPLGPKGQGRVDKRLEQLRDMEQRLAILSAEYKDTYPDIISLREEVRRLRSDQGISGEPIQEGSMEAAGKDRGTKAKLGAVADPYLNDLLNQRNEAKNELAVQRQRQARIAAQIAEFEGRVDRIPAREQELVMLNRDYDNLQRNYQSLLDKRLSASISENLERRQKGEQFRVMDPAFLPLAPETPNTLAIMLGGMFLGLGIGYGCAFWLEHGRGMIRTSGDAEALTGFPVLATISDFSTVYTMRKIARYLPLIGHESDFSSVAGSSTESAGPVTSTMSRIWGQKRPRSGAIKKYEKMDERRLELNQVVKWRPDSVVAEQYRVAATRIILGTSDFKNAVLVVTSAIQGEGKTTSAINLGHVFAGDLGKRTLIIDCDFKRSSLHSYAGLSPSPGLSEVFSGQCPLSASLRRVGDRGPWILAAGSKNQSMADLAHIYKIKPIIEEIRDQFDYILLDAPPVLPLADMNLLSVFADFVVFVVRADSTPKSAVKTAVKSLAVGGGAGVLVTGYSASNMPVYVQPVPYSRQG